MLRGQFLCHVLKVLFFIEIVLKLSNFCKKMQNFRALVYFRAKMQNAKFPLAKTAAPIANIWLRT